MNTVINAINDATDTLEYTLVSALYNFLAMCQDMLIEHANMRWPIDCLDANLDRIADPVPPHGWACTDGCDVHIYHTR